MWQSILGHVCAKRLRIGRSCVVPVVSVYEVIFFQNGTNNYLPKLIT